MCSTRARTEERLRLVRLFAPVSLCLELAFKDTPQ
ncbi:hypothetical protein NB231_03580 [Nitrococcus mobilis Nb-231]|uniref:Uncharacterized protein n=1 Tax=Nitrococcus mobilis Nb-231 TaxID=314278 RepID=A4BRF7_9GAMM|nr:hypothetical protein NB231_03580 [Nitrococcus mobilis Nb-231]